MLSLREPQTAASHYERGNSLARDGRLTEAISSYRHAIDMEPDFAAAHFDLGNALADLGALDDAIDSLEIAALLRPDFVDAHNNLGHALCRQQRFADAIPCFRAVIALQPDLADAHNNLGTALEHQGQVDEAIACYRRAAALRPDFFGALYNLGTSLGRQERHAEARACLEQALTIDPLHAQASNNLANTLYVEERLEEALDYYRRAATIAPNLPEIFYNMGNALRNQGRLGDLPYHLDRLHDAADAFRRAIALRPDYAQAHNNLAQALLTLGEFEEGFQEYEWRWLAPTMISGRRNFPHPQWRGEPGMGRIVLIHAEQGFGDTLQFCRYARLASEAGLQVILEVPACLVRLLRPLAGVDRIVVQGKPLPPFDLHCPMLSLPLAAGTTLATIPGTTPYLHAEASLSAYWRDRLAAMGVAGKRIGLAWRRPPRSRYPQLAAVDARRSIDPALLAPFFAVPGVQFFNLQKDGDPPPAHLPLVNVMPEMTDFAETAALIAQLDLVISIDIVIVHLAAAMGKPVWMLDRYDPCWRWLLGRRDSPWYPGMRIYRQRHLNDWDLVISEVTADLHRVASGACMP